MSCAGDDVAAVMKELEKVFGDMYGSYLDRLKMLRMTAAPTFRCHVQNVKALASKLPDVSARELLAAFYETLDDQAFKEKVINTLPKTIDKAIENAVELLQAGTVYLHMYNPVYTSMQETSIPVSNGSTVAGLMSPYKIPNSTQFEAMEPQTVFRSMRMTDLDTTPIPLSQSFYTAQPSKIPVPSQMKKKEETPTMAMEVKKRFDRKSGKPSQAKPRGSCFKCGQPGHFRKDCPLNNNDALVLDVVSTGNSTNGGQEPGLPPLPSHGNGSLVAMIQLNGRLTRCLIDTGAGVSIVSQELIDLVGAKVEPVMVRINSANLTRLHIVGKAVLNCVLSPREKYSLHVYVSSNLMYRSIIGRKDLATWKAKLDLCSNTLTTRRSVLTLYIDMPIPYAKQSDGVREVLSTDEPTAVKSVWKEADPFAEVLHSKIDCCVIESTVPKKDPHRERKCFSFGDKSDNEKMHEFMLEYLERGKYESLFVNKLEQPGKITGMECSIDLVKDGEKLLVSQQPYRTGIKEKKIIDEAVDDMLKKGIISESNSSYASPVVLIPKPDGEVRFCVNYKKLNNLTRPLVYPFPHVDDIYSALQHASVFSILDCAAGYHQIPVREEDRWLTAFTTHRGVYEFNVMPFGLKNAPALFQKDDIIIFSNDVESHITHLDKILQILFKNNVQLNRKKSKFFRTSVKFLGHIINNGSISIDPDRINSIINLPQPTNVNQLQKLLGILNYNRKFIINFASIAAPLHRLLNKDTRWEWSEECKNAVKTIVDRMKDSGILKIPDLNKEFVLETDASGVGIGGALFQNGMLVSAYSRKLTAAEKNYHSGELECLSLVDSVKHFRHILGSAFFTAVTDNQALKVLNDKSPKNARILRWSMFLQGFNYVIRYRAGKHNDFADGLSRLPVDRDEL
ncbi:Polyprotein [Heterostelium album PN500]|uniref:RNA-directed DNA polymerase n=1 Tax=Heterostelium pallidum (strain ATCC 26659 / Pp 5 / PN500) TaxID=670386 RepID=D3BR94_HETP5|nr:Polyprotein [Heterostelium album PN500]EFA75926.1 Polyprotein [Heterostelium album PN500]|eukprot:XP_020428060.1 Polyprotein [Heterostelium album PN500]